MEPPGLPTDPPPAIDHSAPFKGIVVCCTSIPPEGRTVVTQRVNELGGVHKYDLTPDVTHLIIGEYDTPKYRHVARERPDIKAMDASWIDAVTELWKNDDDFNFEALEKEHQLKALERCGSLPASLAGDSSPREGLLICLTGFGDAREGIAEKIAVNGGRYTGDLTKRCSHLIVHSPEGKKFTAAKSWGIHTVSLAWLEQSLERGLILEEAKFDPQLPPEEQGVGAWIKKDTRRASLGKRSRSGTAGPGDDVKGPRKLRKTASMKLNSQRDGLWSDILTRTDSKEYSFADEQRPGKPVKAEVVTQENQQHQAQPQQTTPPEDQGIFSNCTFYIHGFSGQRTQVLSQTISSIGGSTTSSLDSLLNTSSPEGHRFLIVPQNSQPDTHPKEQHDSVHIVTEFYVEKCLHNKQLFDPSEHTLGRPFPAFPIPGLADLAVCTAAFTGIELSQVARTITQLGATFIEEFRPTVSVLVCRTLESTRKEKLKCALAWGVPVVSADWLWECIATGCAVPMNDFTFSQLKKRQSSSGEQQPPSRRSQQGSVPSLPPTAPAPRTSRLPAAGVDRSGFDENETASKLTKPAKQTGKNDSATAADFQPSRANPNASRDTDSPLTELSSASLNKSPSPSKALRTKSEPTARSKASVKNAPVSPERAPSAPPPDVKVAVAEGEEREAEQQAQEARHKALFTSRIASLVETTTAAASPSPVSVASPDDPLAPKPRRRQLLGRATSNVSATSSNANTTIAPSKTAVEGVFADDAEEGGEGDIEREHPGTQLAYDDPAAQGVKAQIMSKMAGEDVGLQTGGLDSVVAGGRTLRRR